MTFSGTVQFGCEWGSKSCTCIETVCCGLLFTIWADPSGREV